MRRKIPRSPRHERVARLARTPVREWVEAIRRRRGAGRVSPLERVMRRAAAVRIGRSFFALVRVQLLLAAGEVREIERLQPRPARMEHARMQSGTERTHALRTQHVRHERRVERVTRIASHEAAPRANVLTRVERQLATPRIQLTMVCHRPAEAREAPRSADAAAIASDSMRTDARQPRPAAPAAPFVLPAQELSRLTDHVIRQLDHRVLSWQERTGRAP